MASAENQSQEQDHQDQHHSSGACADDASTAAIANVTDNLEAVRLSTADGDSQRDTNNNNKTNIANDGQPQPIQQENTAVAAAAVSPFSDPSGQSFGAQSFVSYPGATSPTSPVPAAPFVIHHFDFPSELVGILIGRFGRNIQRLQEMTGAAVSITKVVGIAGYQLCTVCGPAEMVGNALAVLRERFPDVDQQLLTVVPPHQVPPGMLPYNGPLDATSGGPYSLSSPQYQLQYTSAGQASPFTPQPYSMLHQHPPYNAHDLPQPPSAHQMSSRGGPPPHADITRLRLAENTALDLCVSAIYSANHIAVQQYTHPFFKEFEKLTTLMNRTYNDPTTAPPPMTSPPPVGVLVCAPLPSATPTTTVANGDVKDDSSRHDESKNDRYDDSLTSSSSRVVSSPPPVKSWGRAVTLRVDHHQPQQQQQPQTNDAQSATSLAPSVGVSSSVATSIEASVELHFIDYGYIATLSWHHIRPTRSDFTLLPFQAIECQIMHVAPLLNNSQQKQSSDGVAAGDDVTAVTSVDAGFSDEAVEALREAVDGRYLVGVCRGRVLQPDGSVLHRLDRLTIATTSSDELPTPHNKGDGETDEGGCLDVARRLASAGVTRYVVESKADPNENDRAATVSTPPTTLVS